MSSSIRAFDHWTLTVSDLTRATAFYRDVLGWHPVETTAASDDEAWGPLPGRADMTARTARFVRDGQRVELASYSGTVWTSDPAPQVNHAGLSHMTVATGPTEDVLNELRKRGVHVREHTRSSFVPGNEGPGNQFLFEDPDGNVIETYESNDEWNSFGVGESESGGASMAGISHASHWSLCVKHPARSLPFYRDILGWEELSVFDWEGPGPSRVMDVGPARLTTWLLGVSGQRIEIIHFAEPPVTERGEATSRTGLSHMTVVVDDVGEAASALARADANPTITKGCLGEAVVFQDPDGNVIRGVPHEGSWR